MTKEPILSAKDVEIQFSLRGRKLTAIRRCSLDLYEGETLAIVGESGSGKSVFTKSFLGMLDSNGSITHGSIMYDGKIWQNIKKRGLENNPWKENFYGNAGSDDFSESIEKSRKTDSGKYRIESGN